MSIATMILGQSGTGKSTSLRNLDPTKTLLIQCVKKPLPFKSNWTEVSAENQSGNIMVRSDSEKIISAMERTSRDIVVIDDFQYLLAQEFMNRSHETGYAKFTEMARHYYDVLMKASSLADHKRVYLLSHTEQSESGQVKAKTIGKLLDEKITVEGLLTIVLRTHVINGNYKFSTQNSGQDTVKTPMGMFEQELIDNDLSAVDSAICEYYGIQSTQTKAS